MRAIGDHSLISVTTAAILALAAWIAPVHAQTAADAALNMANMLDGAGGGVSGDDLLAALEDATSAGQPMAMWQLGTMYENGEGVDKDPVKAFGYFAQIANQHADAVGGQGDQTLGGAFVTFTRPRICIDLSGHKKEIVAYAVQHNSGIKHPQVVAYISIGKAHIPEQPGYHAQQ